MIAFGPFVSRVSEKSVVARDVDGPGTALENTGCVFEFSSAGQGAAIPIYRRLEDNAMATFGSYFFRGEDAPFNFRYLPRDALKTKSGTFVELERMIVALYEGQVARPLTEFLSEFRGALPLEKSRYDDPLPIFTAPIAELGFNLRHLTAYGRTITVGVGWFCPQDRTHIESAPSFPSGALELRPRPDGTLSEGRWLEPMPGHMNSMLRSILLKAVGGPPLQAISEEGKTRLLSSFTWTKLAKMSRKEARRARVDFAKSNPALLEKPEELARALRQAELYTSSTPLSYIVRQLATIIPEAKG